MNSMQISTTADCISETELRKLVYIIRGQQVMLDKDLASLYQVETKVFNQAVSRNLERFPENFRFQLTQKEYSNMTSQIAQSSRSGGRRYLPYAFTEQGIAMLSGILNNSIAINVSIRIMNAFVEMRHFIANNSVLFERISNVELKQLEYQKNTDERFEKIFHYIDDHAEVNQKIFFDGQIYDAFSLLVSIIKKADREIILIDGYINVNTLDLLAKKRHGVKVTCYTYAKTTLTPRDISLFNAQYGPLIVQNTSIFHDRFLILDNSITYHIGASLKDAGKKCFAISLINDSEIVRELLKRLNTN